MGDFVGGASGGGSAADLAPIITSAASANPALAWFAAASPILGRIVGGSASGPSRADSGGYNSFDHSGFVVNFGKGTASATGSTSPWWIAPLALGALGLIVWAKKH